MHNLYTGVDRFDYCDFSQDDCGFVDETDLSPQKWHRMITELPNNINSTGVYMLDKVSSGVCPVCARSWECAWSVPGIMTVNCDVTIEFKQGCKCCLNNTCALLGVCPV